MKKIFLLIIILLLAVSTVITPTVSAEETCYSIITDSFGKKYWENLDWVNNSEYSTGVVKVGDWYYQYIKNLETKNIGIRVCGYSGNKTEIEIPSELKGINISGINQFYLFSKTVKTIKIPREIVFINTAVIYEESDLSMDEGYYFDKESPIIECVDDAQLEEIIVDTENPYYSSLDGVLFTKNNIRLIYFPHFKSGKYIVPDKVKYISKGAFAGAKNLKSLTITPNVKELGFGCIPQKGLEELHYENAILPGPRRFDPDSIGDSYLSIYIPDVPDTIVYCIENSDLFKYYKDSLKDPEAMCKELKVLPPFTETLKKEADGKWQYYCNDYQMHSSTLVKYEGVWFYVSDGIWDKTVNNEVISYKNKWFLIQNGKWNKKVNGLFKIGSAWEYFENGKPCGLQKLIKYKDKWFFVHEGCWNKTVNTLFKKNGKWFAIKSGKWYKDKAIIKYEGKKFYVNKGFVQFKYSGNVKINGKTYKIKNGKVA